MLQYKFVKNFLLLQSFVISNRAESKFLKAETDELYKNAKFDSEIEALYSELFAVIITFKV